MEIFLIKFDHILYLVKTPKDPLSVYQILTYTTQTKYMHIKKKTHKLKETLFHSLRYSNVKVCCHRDVAFKWQEPKNSKCFGGY